MKYVILFFFFLSCKKDCMEFPENSIIRLNEYTYGCNDDKKVCLPFSDLNDLRFQVITDFHHLDGDNMNTVLFVPCGEYSPFDLYAMAYGIYTAPISSTGDYGGNLGIQVSTADWNILRPRVGYFMYFTGGCTSGGAYEYPPGFYEIIGIDEALKLVDLGLEYNGVIFPTACGYTTFCLTIYSDNGFLWGKAAEPRDGNYVWDIYAPFGSQFQGFTEPGDCFNLCAYKVTAETPTPCDHPASVSIDSLGQTNCFRKVESLCYTSKIEYSYDDDSMGFYSGFIQRARIDMWLNRPQYPGEEKGYQKSDGSYKKLSERVNKEWQLETDYLTDDLHKNIRMALSADNIQITSENQTVQGAYRSESYDIGWPEDIDYRIAKATTKISKNLLVSSVNSNCV